MPLPNSSPTAEGNSISPSFPNSPFSAPRHALSSMGLSSTLSTLRTATGKQKTKKTTSNAKSRAKLDKGYPRDNIIFQAPERAVLYQAGARVADEDISKSDNLAQLVNHFFDYKAPHIEEWEKPSANSPSAFPELAEAVKKIIDAERKHSQAFVRSFEDFYALCRQAINPNLSAEAVERMLIQHLLTERIFERIFDNPDFTRRNVVAAEIEKVIVELTKRAFNRNEFLRPLDRFYKAIEVSAENTTELLRKTGRSSTKSTSASSRATLPKKLTRTASSTLRSPSSISWCAASKRSCRKNSAARSATKASTSSIPSSAPATSSSASCRKSRATDLQYKYENELHCNEVMLLPYYIASMNIEHAYFERTGEYKAFPGICLVDTFELAEPEQAALTS